MARRSPGSPSRAYWWWPGNAVTKEDLTWNLETYRRAGWGNMGVIGIYGVRGEEDRFIDIFSPKWFEMFNHTVTEAKRLGMNIDLTPSSGWRLGGPHVTPQYAEQTFEVENGQIVVRPNNAACQTSRTRRTRLGRQSLFRGSGRLSSELGRPTLYRRHGRRPACVLLRFVRESRATGAPNS